MTTDEKVELARQLAERLRIKRSEWRRWVNYFSQCGDLEKALKLAEYLARSPAVRSEPQKANKQIRSVLSERIGNLRNLPFNALVEIFGYVGWWLVWLQESGTETSRTKPQRK
ncbi:MAG: hypothetical protein NZ805_02505 [Armatimonadetes bacterium]|nr:hypothetical protein [Armatimonadota bacterium]MDW8028160.1 hypothetical protein [Armatimonadota bacterium]